jgi:hypothetical protein
MCKCATKLRVVRSRATAILWTPVAKDDDGLPEVQSRLVPKVKVRDVIENPVGEAHSASSYENFKM